MLSALIKKIEEDPIYLPTLPREEKTQKLRLLKEKLGII